MDVGDIGARVRCRQTQVGPRCGSGDPSPWCPGEEPVAHQEGLGDLLDGLAFLTDGDGERAEPDGAAVVGVSPDSVARHRKFVDKESLDFPLLADEDGSVAKAYGAHAPLIGTRRAVVIVDENGSRLIGFGRYAGIVGAYNAFRAFGLRDEIYELPKVESLPDMEELLEQLKKVKLPAVKIVLTGNGKVAHGAKEILDALQLRQVSVGEYLSEDFEYPVYCMIDVMDYNKRKDGSEGTNQDFYRYPEKYISDFSRFARVSDIFIAGHFYGEGAPVFFTAEEARSSDFRIRLVADISCDIDGPIATTVRASTIADPIYGYNRFTGRETDLHDPEAITVMAVDNLPCELPKDASEGFGEMFLEHVIPAFFNGDKNGVLARARMTRDGRLTPRFSYLEGYVNKLPVS